MLRNYFLINLILLIIVGMLGLRLYKTWVKPLDIAAQKTLQETQKDKNISEDKKTEEKKELSFNEKVYNVIVQNDLFRPSRSAPQIEEIPLYFLDNPPKLYGTIIMGNDKSAILEDPKTKTTKLYRLNDLFGGFTISDIQDNKVVLLMGDESIEVKLREIKTITAPRQQPFMPQQQPQVRPQGSLQRPERPIPIRVPPNVRQGAVVPSPPPAVPSPPPAIGETQQPSPEEKMPHEDEMQGY
ncbi:MAG TPA: hypothetical protein VJ000_02810 [Thermodesulfovibrionia bacterium]|nr:hypothetical protein [Thermodesulfovibrionia bacterium]